MQQLTTLLTSRPAETLEQLRRACHSMLPGYKELIRDHQYEVTMTPKASSVSTSASRHYTLTTGILLFSYWSCEFVTFSVISLDNFSSPLCSQNDKYLRASQRRSLSALGNNSPSLLTLPASRVP